MWYKYTTLFFFTPKQSGLRSTLSRQYHIYPNNSMRRIPMRLPPQLLTASNITKRPRRTWVGTTYVLFKPPLAVLFDSMVPSKTRSVLVTFVPNTPVGSVSVTYTRRLFTPKGVNAVPKTVMSTKLIIAICNRESAVGS